MKAVSVNIIGYVVNEMQEYYRNMFIEDCITIIELTNKIIGDEDTKSERTRIEVMGSAIDLAGLKCENCGPCNIGTKEYDVDDYGFPKARIIDFLGNDFTMALKVRA